MSKCDFNKTLSKSHFDMGVLLLTCCIFSEHPLLGTPLNCCFCNFELVASLRGKYFSSK